MDENDLEYGLMCIYIITCLHGVCEIDSRMLNKQISSEFRRAQSRHTFFLASGITLKNQTSGDF